MNSEAVKSPSESNDSNNNKHMMDPNNNETISVRLARYLDHIKRLKSQNTQHLIKEAESRFTQQQQLYTNDLNDLQKQYERQLRTNREKTETVLKAKLKCAELASKREKETLDRVMKTLNFTHNQINDTESRVVALLERTNRTLNDTICDLQTDLDNEKSQADDLQAEIIRLQEELALKIEQHKRLSESEEDDSLSLEIAKFNHLLSGEEKRIKLSETV